MGRGGVVEEISVNNWTCCKTNFHNYKSELRVVWVIDSKVDSNCVKFWIINLGRY